MGDFAGIATEITGILPGMFPMKGLLDKPSAVRFVRPPKKSGMLPKVARLLVYTSSASLLEGFIGSPNPVRFVLAARRGEFCASRSKSPKGPQPKPDDVNLHNNFTN